MRATKHTDLADRCFHVFWVPEFTIESQDKGPLGVTLIHIAIALKSHS